MPKLSKHAQLFKLVDRFIDHYPETSLAQEWRELTANGVVSAFQLATPAEQLESHLEPEARDALSIIKPLLGIK